MATIPYGVPVAIFKRWRLFMTIFLAVVLSGVAYLAIATKKYESTAELVITFGNWSTPEVERAPATELTPSDRREIVLANAAILHSHDLAQATIEAFGLDRVYPDIAEKPPSKGTPMDAAVTRFLGSLQAVAGAQDNIITLSLQHPDRELAPRLVRKLIDLYVARQTQIYHNPHEGFLASEVQQAGARLTRAQNALEEFKDRWGITNYDEEEQNLLTQRGDLDTSLHVARANLAAARQKQTQLEQLLKTVPQKVPETANGEKYRAVDEARTRLAELQTKQSQMLTTYRPGGPATAALRAGIAAAQKEVDAREAELDGRSTTAPNTVYQTVETDYLRAAADAKSSAEPVQVLEGQMAALDKRLADLRGNRSTFNGLTREYQMAEDAYKTLSVQHTDALVKGNLNNERISPATVLSEPTHPYRPVRPRTLITLVTCLFGGFILATIAVLMREARDDRFTTAEQVVYLLDLPVLASFERQPHRPPLQLLAYGDGE